MSFLFPSAFLLGLLSLPIIILYMLKLRRREVEVPSTMLWQMLLRDRQANAPWQRLKRNLLLFLQLLILSALMLALARPVVSVPTIATGSITVLIDGSASMQATDLEPNRFSAAVREVDDLIDRLSRNSRMSLILVKRPPEVLTASESDQTRLHRALAAAAPGTGTADWEAALALAAGVSARDPEGASTIIVSDGGLPGEGLPPLPGEVKYLPVGQSADNLAISAFASRRSANEEELFARVSNYGNRDRTVVFSLYREGRLIDARQLVVPANGDAPVLISDLPLEFGIYQARLENLVSGTPVDDFPLDDNAFTVVIPPRSGNSLLVSEGNVFLEQVLAVLPNLTPYRAVPSEEGTFSLPATPFDLYIFDGWMPDELPHGNLLLINPPANDLFEVTGVTDQLDHPVVADHPLMRFVSWDEIQVLQARVIKPPVWADILVNTEATPLIFAGETQGRRVAVIAFDLHNSNLPLKVSFPILLSNLSQFLVPGQAFSAPDGLQPGDTLSILPDLNVTEVVIASPSGKVFTPPITENGITFSDTGELGVYAVNYLSRDSQSADYFAVNLFSPVESRIAPVQNIQVGQSLISQQAGGEAGQRELWPWFSALALVFLVLEWGVYHRRLTPSTVR